MRDNLFFKYFLRVYGLENKVYTFLESTLREESNDVWIKNICPGVKVRETILTWLYFY